MKSFLKGIGPYFNNEIAPVGLGLLTYFYAMNKFNLIVGEGRP